MLLDPQKQHSQKTAPDNGDGRRRDAGKIILPKNLSQRNITDLSDTVSSWFTNRPCRFTGVDSCERAVLGPWQGAKKYIPSFFFRHPGQYISASGPSRPCWIRVVDLGNPPVAVPIQEPPGGSATCVPGGSEPPGTHVVDPMPPDAQHTWRKIPMK